MTRPGVAVVAQSGGPTSVINASLLGIFEEAAQHAQITSVYGAQDGIAGILSEDFLDLTRQPAKLMLQVGKSPSSALGSSRRELAAGDLERVIEVFSAHNVRYFLYNGGNGSMGTASQIASAARELSYDLQVVGIPKTIDNDLLETDHTPGYPSTARFFACALRDIGADNLALSGQVEIVEVLGRNVGWIAAATALARRDPADAPHLIYFPECPLPAQRFLEDVERVYRRLGRCVVAVCEGQLDESGDPFGADVRSGSRGSLAMNLAHRLAMLVSSRLRIRARSEKPGLLGRSSALSVSAVDWNEARECGLAAVQAAVAGLGGNMVTLVRNSQEPYHASTGLAPLERVALLERAFPDAWRNAAGNDVAPEFISYISPLVGEIEKHRLLQRHLVPKKMTAQISSGRPAENPPSTTSA
jgi:6-phosphofructokinase 1